MLLDVPREVVALTPTDVDQSEFWENMLVRMRALVAEHWPRIDVSWHRPALWVSAATEHVGQAAANLIDGGGQVAQGMHHGAGEAARGGADAMAAALGGGQPAAGGGMAAASGVGSGATTGSGAMSAGGAATGAGAGKMVGMIAAGGVAIGVVAGGAAYLGSQANEEEPVASSTVEDTEPAPVEEVDETVTHVLTLEDSQDPRQVERLADALQQESAQTFVLDITVDPDSVNTALWPYEEDDPLGSTPHDALVLNSDCWDPELDCDSALVLYFLDGYAWEEQEGGMGFARTFRVGEMAGNDEEWLGTDWVGGFPGLHVTLEQVPE